MIMFVISISFLGLNLEQFVNSFLIAKNIYDGQIDHLTQVDQVCLCSVLDAQFLFNSFLILFRFFRQFLLTRFYLRLLSKNFHLDGLVMLLIFEVV